MKTKTRQGGELILLAGCLWGIIGIFVKQLEACGISVEMISLIRVAFASVIMFFLCIIKYGIASLYVNKKTIGICALLGIVCHGVYNIFYSIAVVEAGVSISAVLLDVAPVFTLIFSMILFQESLNSKKIIGIVINIVGCILATTNGNFDVKFIPIMGILCGVGAGLSYSLTAVIGRLAGNKTNPFIMSFYSYVAATLFLVVYMMVKQSVWTISKAAMGIGFLYALIPTAIAYIIYYKGVQMMDDISKVPILASLEVVVACVLGVGLYQEVMGTGNIIGIFLVLISIVIMNLEK